MDREPAIPRTEGAIWDGISHNLSHFFVIARNRKFYSEKHLAGGIEALEELRNITVNSIKKEKIDNLLIKLKSIDVNSAVEPTLISEIQADLKDIRAQADEITVEQKLLKLCKSLDAGSAIEQEGDTLKIYMDAGGRQRLREKSYRISDLIKKSELLHNFHGLDSFQITADVKDLNSTIKRIEIYLSKDY